MRSSIVPDWFKYALIIVGICYALFGKFIFHAMLFISGGLICTLPAIIIGIYLGAGSITLIGVSILGFIIGGILMIIFFYAIIVVASGIIGLIIGYIFFPDNGILIIIVAICFIIIALILVNILLVVFTSLEGGLLVALGIFLFTGDFSFIVVATVTLIGIAVQFSGLGEIVGNVLLKIFSYPLKLIGNFLAFVSHKILKRPSKIQALLDKEKLAREKRLVKETKFKKELTDEEKKLFEKSHKNAGIYYYCAFFGPIVLMVIFYIIGLIIENWLLLGLMSSFFFISIYWMSKITKYSTCSRCGKIRKVKISRCESCGYDILDNYKITKFLPGNIENTTKPLQPSRKTEYTPKYKPEVKMLTTVESIPPRQTMKSGICQQCGSKNLQIFSDGSGFCNDCKRTFM